MKSVRILINYTLTSVYHSFNPVLIVNDSVRQDSIWNSVNRCVRNSVRNYVWKSVNRCVRNSVRNSVQDSVSRNFVNELR